MEYIIDTIQDSGKIGNPKYTLSKHSSPRFFIECKMQLYCKLWKLDCGGVRGKEQHKLIIFSSILLNQQYMFVMSMSGAHTQAKHGDPHIHIIHNFYWFNGNKEGNNWSPSSVQLFS